jgi:MFS transporter, DHA1 family, multidrug resistance protein
MADSLKPIQEHNRFLVIFLIIAPFLAGIGVDLYVPSLPIITRDLQAPKQLAQLTVSIYLIGYGLGQLFLGIVSDSAGRKKTVAWSSFFFVIISILCAFARDIYSLNLGRFLQGVFVGGILSSSRAVVTDSYTGLARSKMMTCIAMSWALGPIIGPFIGGYLQHFLGWRADFYFFALYGLLVLFCSLLMPETHLHLAKLHLSTILKNIKYVATHPIFLSSSLIAALIYSILVIFNIVGPFLIQDILHYSVISYGYLALLLGVGYFLGSLVNRFLIHHFHASSIVFFSILASLIVGLTMIIVDALFTMTLYTILLPTFMLFFLSGLNFPNAMTRAVGLFPQMAGLTSAIFGLIIATGTFLLAGFAIVLKTETQLPASMTYTGIIVLCLILFLIFLRKESKPI